LHGNLTRMRSAVEHLLRIYGRGNVFLEIMNHNIEKEQFVIEQFSILSKKLRVPMVATNNDRFSLKEESEYYAVLRAISGEKEKRDPEVLSEYHMKKKQELEPFFYVVSESLDESGRIAERCRVELSSGSTIRFTGDTAPDDILRERCERRFLLAFHSRKKSELGPLRKKIETELNEAAREGISGFMLFLSKLFGNCGKRGVRLEIMGGEILDSLIAYLLGIIPLDPVRHGLVFESFNIARKGVPRQVEIIKPRGVRETFMSVLGALLPKSGIFNQIVREEMSFPTLVREISSIAGIPSDTREALLGAVGSTRRKESLHAMLDGSEQLTRLYNSDRKIRKILHSAKALSGKVFHFNHNTSRLVILPEDQRSLVGCIAGENGSHFCMVDGKTIEQLGGWVILLQTSHFLTALDGSLAAPGGRLEDRVDAGQGEMAAFESLDDPETFRMISSGNTTGVYLLESRGIRELLEKIQPGSFEELVNVISLYRPAPLEGKLWQKYIENADKKGKVFLPHHSLAHALEGTRGLLLFRQQVRAILRDSAGITGEKAVLIENAVSTRDAGDLLKARLEFIRGAMDRDINEEDA
ncbi:MAG TPA: hypothetical protein VLA34_06075, partial [Candidatus Krumholzibacterium sp.]|nr:hypothetical protein [Candidatus Krumholzibacterium sp.]